MWYDNFDCASSLATKLLVIEKALIITQNFPNKQIKVESDCKVVVEALLCISPIPWRVCAVLKI